MALNTLLVKQFQEVFEETNNVIATTDLKLLCIHKNQLDLCIILVNSSSKLLLKNIKEFSWQEDNYCPHDYRLLVVNEINEILYYSVKIESLNSGLQHLVEKKLAKWTVNNIFRYFGELAKCLENLSSVEILKFEAKEAVCLFNKNIVAAFFPSCEENPQIMSVSDLRYDSSSYRKVLISKEILFALNEEGTRISIHSFANNTKLFDIEFFDGHLKQSEIGSVINYTVNLKLDLLVYVTEKQQVFTMPLNVPKFFSSTTQPLGNSSITAFTKQFPSVKRLNEKMRRFSTSSTSSLPVSFNCELGDLTLKELVVIENKIFFLQKNSSESLVGVHLLHSDQASSYKRFSHPVHFIKSGSEETPFPLLLLSEDKMFLLLYDVEQDKLVNELMIYPSSKTVETLSSLNNWVNMHMDIEVLKLGLSNRQLYTVEFFLKTLYEGFCQLCNSSKTLQWLKKMEQECVLWTKVLSLVLDNVYKNIGDNYSCQYAEQLLQVIIGIVTQILAKIEDKAQINELVTLNAKETFLKTFSELLLKMRKLLREFDVSSDEAVEPEETSMISHTYDEQIQLQWKQWEKLEPKKVIQDSILRGVIPMAQSYFSCCCKGNCNFSYAEFETVAKELVLDYLRQGKLDETIVILINMGANINQRLLDIFKSTSEKDIRALLVTELMNRNLLTDRDLGSLRFVSLLEKLYSCSSFEHARILLEEKSALTEDMICAVPESKERLKVGDFKNFIQDNSETGAYCRLVIDWLEIWDGEIKGRILAPLYLTNSNNLESILKTDGFLEADKMSVWFYLLENGNLPYLMNWIDIWLGIHPQSTDSFSLFDKWPLTKDMIDVIPLKATKHVSEIILNILARHGIFCEEEQENITLFLTRVGRAQCNINDLSIFSSDKATITFSELCHRLVHYFLKHNLIHFLYTFINENYDKFTTWPSCPLCLVPVFHLTVAFYKWSQNHNDVNLAYEAVTETASYLFNLSQASPTELLLKVPLPLALSILLFKPQSLKESIDVVMQSSNETIESVKRNFINYPLLYNYLFKTEEERSQPDVTVYELLKDNTVFDTSQLFGWQSANSLKSEDSQNELPHFSLPSLSEQFGLKKELTYLYYLMEGRPNYSYLKFFAQEVILETGLSLSRVKATCREVIDYALTNYKSLDVCASCIAFIELLGQDSLTLRASLVAANMLHDSRISEGDTDYDKSFPDIGRKFKQAYVDKTHAQSLVSEIENIILNKWNPFNSDAYSLFQDIILWMPSMTISHLYEVEAGNHYLYECAKQNKWLQFLVFAQIFQIPKEQVLKAASRFSNSCISYHIFHSLHRKSSLLYDVAYETKTVTAYKSQKKDTRRSLYSRIGVIKDAPAIESKKTTELDDDKLSVTSEETSTSSDTDLRSYVLKDLFSQLLLAHGSDSPSDCLLHTSYEIQNPILAALAASYPEAPLDVCFFMWLYTSLGHNETIRKQLETSFPELRIPSINTDDLENLIVIAVQHHKIITLWQGVHIFLPNTPLPSLMGFLRSFMVYKRFDSSIEAFQNKLWDYPKNSEKSSILHSLFWIENISVTILKEAVISCLSNYERQLLLRHFSHTRLEKSFSKEVVVPQFIKVYHMRQCLGDVAQDIDVKNLFLPENENQYKATCWEAVTKLLQHHLYEDAQLFSEHAKLPQDQMLMLQINQETEEARISHSWQDLSNRIHFWQNNMLKLQVLSLHTAVDFLEDQCEISDMYGEKYFLMKSIVDMIKDNLIQDTTDGNIYNLDSLNKKMWWFCIKAEVNNELLPEIFDIKAVFELNIQEIFFSKKLVPNVCCIEDEKEKEALGSIIGRFLNKSDIHSAFQLALTFGYDSLDLKIIKLCFEVAKGETDISSVDMSMPDCSTDITSTRVIQSLILWVNRNSTDLTPSQKSSIQCIKGLSRKCIIAVKICYQILVHYIISLVLKEDFINNAQEKDAFSILKKILIHKLNDELVVAKSFILVRDLSDKEVANFLSDEIWNSLKILRSYDLVKIPEEESAFSEQVIYDPLRANEGFQLIVKLCQNPSVLGYSLMSIYSAESAELNSKSSDGDFTVLVDLCICAHECFTAACNMDGISQILHSAQTLVTMLEEAEKYSTMVHLLTGLDRYSEMMYVFDILKSHDKFGILFEKKMDNVPNLRLALLDYLKKYPPSENDNYFYTLANRFGMHREKAEILEMSVQKLLSQLCKRNSALDSDMKDELENVLQILSDAAKSYCMADCLHQAQNCTRLAQLVALQIYFVPDGVWIIGLDETSVARFITDHNRFSQAFIVAEEYGNHHLWSQALLHNVIVRGDRDYLLEFQAHFGLPTSLISDVVKRYKKLPTKNENTTRNIKLLLSLCSNIKVKYSLAHEMGFTDVVSELLMGEASSYLQDLIANNSIK